jgi:hypothetical protein
LGAALGSDHLVADDATRPDLKPLLGEVRKLVERYYPKAKVTLKDQTIHFEFNTRKFMIHEPLLTGEWQDAVETVGPQKGGIWGEIELCPGRYEGMLALPQTFDKRYFTQKLTFSYSEKLHHYLHIQLEYPRNTPKEFIEEFEALTNKFDSYVIVKGK